MAVPLSHARIVSAFTVAVLADLIQLPLIAAFDTAVLAIPAEAAILFVDLAAFALTTAPLRFHWVLLPSLAIEAIPNLDAVPTWTGCVAFVVWARRRENRGEPTPIIPKNSAHPSNVIDV
jgi:hypothetical protein